MSHGRKLISFLGHTKSSREALAAEVGWRVVGDALWADRLLPVGHAPPSWDTPRLLEHAPPLGTRPASWDTPRLPGHAPPSETRPTQELLAPLPPQGCQHRPRGPGNQHFLPARHFHPLLPNPTNSPEEIKHVEVTRLMGGSDVSKKGRVWRVNASDQNGNQNSDKFCPLKFHFS